MKKQLALLLSLVLLLSICVTACSTDNADETKKPTTQNNTPDSSDNLGNDTDDETDPDTPVNPGTDIDSNELTFNLINNGTEYEVSSVKNTLCRDITVPGTYNGKPVTKIGDNAFEGCVILQSVTLPDSITCIGDSAFSSCASLTSVTIPEGVTTIGDSAFYSCMALTSVTVPNSITKLGNDAFYFCDKIKYNEYDNAYYLGNTENPCVILMKAKDADISSCEINNKTKIIYDNAFVGCNKLVSIDLSNSIISIGEMAFYSTSIESISIPANVKYIGNAAFASMSLNSITVNADNAAYTSKGNCLIEVATKTLIAGCMESIIPNDNSIEHIGDKAFYGFTLKTLTLPESIVSIGNEAFDNCYTIAEEIIIPKNVTSIGTRAFSPYIFEVVKVAPENTTYILKDNCLIEIASKKLILGKETSVIPSDGSVTVIGESAFEGCDIKNIIIPACITAIEDYAFQYCSYLEGVTFEENSQLTSIGKDAFCFSNIVSITIPASVTSISSSAFSLCLELETITFENAENWYTTDNEENWKNKTGGTLVDLSDASTNATHFTSTYEYDYWYKA